MSVVNDKIRYDLPMPLLQASFEPGHLSEALDSIEDRHVRDIAIAEAHYFKGEPDEACVKAEPYLESDDMALRISACFICSYANLSLNRSYAARMCLEKLHSLKDDPRVHASDDLYGSYLLFSLASCVLLHLKPAVPVDELSGLVSKLPEGLRLFASYVIAHYLYLKGEHGRCLGMAEHALMVKQQAYPVSELFLHLVAAMGSASLKDMELAQSYFSAGWDIARPDDLIEEIGEHHGLLQGVLETCLKDDYPQDFARIIKITYRFSYGWRRIHNPDTGENVADNLTTTEFTIAMLACRGWSNDEISQHLGISKGTVKNRLSAVYAKLGITNRANLKDFMLR